MEVGAQQFSVHLEDFFQQHHLEIWLSLRKEIMNNNSMKTIQ
jgi:hypothetical protein